MNDTSGRSGPSRSGRAATIAARGQRPRAVTAPVRVLLALVLVVWTAGCADAETRQSQLQAMVDSLLPTVERLSGLSARAPVRAERRTPEELRAYVSDQMARELPPSELERIEATYKELGLLPDTLALRPLMLDLLSEQVVGYYDPPTETFYLVEGVPTEAAEPIIAHELVHALQDQYVDLDSLIAPEVGNDRASAAQAAVEGHATLVMFAMLLAQRTGGRDITELPAIGSRVRAALESQNDALPVFASAPRILRETLIFPYVDGADFVQAIWKARGAGERPPFRLILPESSEQVLHPLERFVTQRDTPTTVRLAEPGEGWSTVYEDVLGELELGILLEQHLGLGADSLAVGWDGDVVRLLEDESGKRALVLASVWDDAVAADRFAAAYRDVLAAREGRHGSVRRLEVDGRPVVLAVDARADLSPSALPAPEVRGLSQRTASDRPERAPAAARSSEDAAAAPGQAP